MNGILRNSKFLANRFGLGPNEPLTVGRVAFRQAPCASDTLSGTPVQSFYRPPTRPAVARGTLIVGVIGAVYNDRGELVGSAGAGKDAVVSHIVETYGRIGGQKTPQNDGPIDVRRYALADAVKLEAYDWLAIAQAMNVIFGGDVLVPGGAWPEFKTVRTDADKLIWINENKGLLRQLLQVWGTELRRAQDPEYWTKRLLERVTHDRPAVAMISDVRFRNETDICHVAVRVEKRGGAYVLGSTAAHASENELRDYRADYTISANAGDLPELHRQAEDVFERILEKFHVQ